MEWRIFGTLRNGDLLQALKNSDLWCLECDSVRAGCAHGFYGPRWPQVFGRNRKGPKRVIFSLFEEVLRGTLEGRMDKYFCLQNQSSLGGKCSCPPPPPEHAT